MLLFFLCLFHLAHAELPFAPAEIGSARQLIVVEGKGVDAEVSLYQKDENLWHRVNGPWPAVVGRHGVIDARKKREGDGHTPAGLYQLGFSFGAASHSLATWPYRQMTAQDKWVDDPASRDYNKFVHGNTSARSFEKMKRGDGVYDWGLVIEYNTHPIVADRGSAIFLHIWRGPHQGTAGCVALEKDHVISLLRWLTASRDPRILIK